MDGQGPTKEINTSWSLHGVHTGTYVQILGDHLYAGSPAYLHIYRGLRIVFHVQLPPTEQNTTPNICIRLQQKEKGNFIIGLKGQ
jgi:hypothetical protein